jgi:hypothetical protein
MKLPGRLPVSNKALAFMAGLVIVGAPRWASSSIVVLVGGSVPRQVTGGGGRVALRPVVVVSALSPVVVVCLHFETVTLRYSGSSVSVIVEHTIIGKDLLLCWFTLSLEFVEEVFLYSWSYG